MDPVTVMTCIQVASSVAGMLSPKGPDIGDLINIQTQMIKNISNQVAKLQDGINQIIFDIDNLKTHITYEVPSLIYKEFISNELIAKFSGYERIINTYLEERETKGIFIAYEKNKQDLATILYEIQSKRDQVLNVKDFFLAPIIARCIKVEIDLLIILLGDEIGDKSSAFFKNSLTGYERWLKDMQDLNNSYSVDYKIDALKMEIEKANVNTFGFRMCKINETVKEKDNEFDMITTRYTVNTRVEVFSFKRILNPDVELEITQNKFSYQELEDLYINTNISLAYLPKIVSPTIEEKYSEELIDYKYGDVFIKENKGDGVKADMNKGDIKDERFDINREFIESLTKCDNPSQQILSNKKFPSATDSFKTLTKKMIIPVTHKKIMKDLQDKINSLKIQL